MLGGARSTRSGRGRPVLLRVARQGSIAGRAAPRACRCARTRCSSRRRRRRRRRLRPCKRCRPNEGSRPPGISPRSSAPAPCCGPARRCRASRELADAAGISRFHFHRVFKQITGATPRDMREAHRLGRFADQLDAGEPVTEAIYAAGFGASSRAYEAAPAGLGMTPAARRRGGSGRDDPLRHRRDAARLGDGRRDRARHLHDRARRRSRRPRRRAAAALSRPPRSWPMTRGLKDWADRIVRFITAPERNPRSAARYPRHRVPGAGVARVAEDPARPDRDLYRDRRGARPAEGGARRRAGLRREQAGAARAVPPGGPPRRRSRRLSLGGGAQARAARPRARGGRAGAADEAAA